jgi:hypothetical protein
MYQGQKKLTIPNPHGALPDLKESGYPYSELKSWQTSHIPPNFLEAVSVAVLHEGMKRYKEPLKNSWSPVTDTEFEYISPWIKQNEAAWWEFTAGALKPYCYKAYHYDPNSRDQWSLGFGIPQMLRRLASLGIWKSRLDIKQGHIKQGIEDCLTVARASSHWQGKGRISQQFAGQNMSRLASLEILHIVATQNLAATDLKQLQQQLSRIYPEGYPRMNIETEKLAFLDTIQRVFTEDGFGGGHLIPDRYIDIFEPLTYEDSEAMMFSLPLTTIAGMVHARRDETLRKGNKILDKYNQICKMTPYEKYSSGIGDDETDWSLSHQKYFFLYRSLYDMRQVSEFTYLSEAWYQATITTLAIQRWRLEKNAYPESLSELTAAGFLDELPMDLYSDKPLVYRKTKDDFVLYSLGPNFTDDGGQVAVNGRGEPQNWGTPKAGDIVFWPLTN